MRPLRTLPLVIALGLVPAAQAWDGPGRLVSVLVEVDGRAAPLYPDPQGSGRLYLEAREGSSYAVGLSNRTGQRLGVALAVDSLNAVSGERDAGSSPGRMYVLDPWDATTVRGWRTSLDEVRRFTFVDERVSYAARSGKANGRMGWIEVAVYRERRPSVRRYWDEIGGWLGADRDRAARDDGKREAPYGESSKDAPPATMVPGGGRAAAPPAKAAPESADAQEEKLRSLGYVEDAQRRSYPGTGWGQRTSDPVTVVDFVPEARPADCVMLRYEYAGTLRALGVLPRPWPDRDRLAERERGTGGFVRPPDW